MFASKLWDGAAKRGVGKRVRACILVPEVQLPGGLSVWRDLSYQTMTLLHNMRETEVKKNTGPVRGGSGRSVRLIIFKRSSDG